MLTKKRVHRFFCDVRTPQSKILATHMLHDHLVLLSIKLSSIVLLLQFILSSAGVDCSWSSSGISHVFSISDVSTTQYMHMPVLNIIYVYVHSTYMYMFMSYVHVVAKNYLLHCTKYAFTQNYNCSAQNIQYKCWRMAVRRH